MSSANNKFITHMDAIPVINSDVFHGHANQRFALGVFNSADVLSYKPNSIEEAYLRLRANVYIDQTGMLDQDLRRVDGTEMDEFDKLSTHFVVLENLIEQVSVFACGRLIEKMMHKDIILPIEEYFPEVFFEPAPHNSVEISRFIVRHNDPRCARTAKIRLMTAGLAHAFKKNLEPILCVVEPSFERDLRIMKIPTRRITEPKLVPQYNDHNLGIEIDKQLLRDRLGETEMNHMSIPIGSYVFWGNQPTYKLFDT